MKFRNLTEQEGPVFARRYPMGKPGNCKSTSTEAETGIPRYNFSCIRPAGHDGPHVAHGTHQAPGDTAYAIWGDLEDDRDGQDIAASDEELQAYLDELRGDLIAIEEDQRKLKSRAEHISDLCIQVMDELNLRAAKSFLKEGAK